MHDVGGVGEDADGHGHGVNGHGQAAVVDIAVPEAGRPAALYMDHVAVVVAAVVVAAVVVAAVVVVATYVLRFWFLFASVLLFYNSNIYCSSLIMFLFLLGIKDGHVA